MADRSALKKYGLTNWLPVAPLLLLAALTHWLDRVVQPPPPKRDGSTRHDPDYIVERFSATRTDASGAVRHVLAAERMVHYPDDDSTHLTRPNMVQYAANRPPLRITAREGMISRDGADAHFSGGVRVVREAGRGKSQLSVETEYLHVIPERELAQTDRPVTIRDANSLVTAVGLQLDNKARTATLLSRVRGHYAKPRKN